MEDAARAAHGHRAQVAAFIVPETERAEANRDVQLFMQHPLEPDSSCLKLYMSQF